MFYLKSLAPEIYLLQILTTVNPIYAGFLKMDRERPLPVHTALQLARVALAQSVHFATKQEDQPHPGQSTLTKSMPNGCQDILFLC
jgi:hypothetical protein